MLRANRAIAVILLVVVLLGGVLAFLIVEARQSATRAEKAEAEQTEKVWAASLAQARAENLSTKAGHRETALAAVRTAAAIRPSLELRNEAIAALSQRDLVLEREWIAKPNSYGFAFHTDLKYYVARYQPTVLSMYRLDDNSHVRDFAMPFIFPRSANVGDFQFSATGKYVIIRYNGAPLTVWETETGVLRHVVSNDPRSVKYSWPPTFSADDRLMGLSMSGSEGTQFLYDLEKGAVQPLPAVPEKLRYTGGSNIIRVSPRGDLLAAYEGANIHIIDAATGAIRQSITGPSVVESIMWDRQGERISFSCDNFTLSVWEPKSGRVVQMGGAALVPWNQNFSPDGTTLMTSGQDGITRLWDVNSARLVSEVAGMWGMHISRDGTRLAAGQPGRSVSTWRIVPPAAARSFQGARKERAAMWQQDFSADGRYAVWTAPAWVGGFGYEMLDLQRGGAVLVPQPAKMEAGFRPAHAQFWTLSGNTMSFHPLPAAGLTDAAALEKTESTITLPPGFVATQASFTPDGRRVAVSGSRKALLVLDTEAPDQPVNLEPAYSSHVSIPGPGAPNGAGSMVISPDGKWVVAGRYTDSGGVTVWDAQSGKIIQRLPGGGGHCAFTSDGRYMVSVGADKGRVWSTADWKILWERPRGVLLAWLGTAAFTGDGALLAWARGVTLVELTTTAGEVLAELNLTELNLITGLRFSADGRTLFATGHEGRMLTLDLHALRRELAALHLDWPLPAAAAPAFVEKSSRFSAWSPALFGILPVGLAAVLGVLVLRRQGRLTQEFVEATEVASQSERELAAEREVSELKSRFVTTVSHEFRTPLGITMSAIELLRHYEDRLPPEEKAQLFEDIYSSTRNMAGLMEQVLVLGRVDAGKLAYRPAPLDLDTLARKLTDESHSATNRKCLIEWSVENDLSGATADEALLRHIFSNLLNNGVKYSPAGSTVHFSARREGLMAVFTVKDRGIGIPDADLPKLFEAFHRGSNVGEIPGTGLGLVIIKRCVDLHNGSIRVDSKPGAGTTFTVRIPAWLV